MCRHAGFRWGGAARRELSRCSGAGGGSRGGRLSGFYCLCWVFSLSVSLLLLFPLIAVLLNCPYPNPLVSACFFPFSSTPRWGRGGRVVLLLPAAAEPEDLTLPEFGNFRYSSDYQTIALFLSFLNVFQVLCQIKSSCRRKCCGTNSAFSRYPSASCANATSSPPQILQPPFGKYCCSYNSYCRYSTFDNSPCSHSTWPKGNTQENQSKEKAHHHHQNHR